ncbi:MAG: hypothetical protein AB8G77_18070 [Rhodothermales bacterium]
MIAHVCSNTKKSRLAVASTVIIWFNIFYIFVFLLLQNIVGMGPGVTHIDEGTYLNPETNVCDGFESFAILIGHSYYCVVAALDYSIPAILLVQILIYISTSFFIYERLKDFCKNNAAYIFLLLVVFDPYRAHLAVHILKETFVIAGVCLMLSNGFLGLFVSTAFRFFSIIYLFITLKPLMITCLLAFLAITLRFLLPDLFFHIQGGGNNEMIFREFDTVPTFNQFGLLGDLVRSLLWPMFLMTGAFVIFAPNLLYFVVALGAAASLNFVILQRMKLKVLIGPFVAMAILAFVTPGFTSFTRYAYPIVIVLPLLSRKHSKSLLAKVKDRNNEQA